MYIFRKTRGTKNHNVWFIKDTSVTSLYYVACFSYHGQSLKNETVNRPKYLQQTALQFFLWYYNIAEGCVIRVRLHTIHQQECKYLALMYLSRKEGGFLYTRFCE